MLWTLFIVGLVASQSGEWGTESSVDEGWPLYPSYNGTDNNVARPTLGTAGSLFSRHSGTVLQSTSGLPNARNVSQTLFDLLYPIAQSASSTASALLPVWGEFLAHMMVGTTRNPADSRPISIPKCDPYLDRFCSGSAAIPYTGPLMQTDPVTGISGPVNQKPSFIHLGNIYGFNAQRAALLRAGVGGRLNLTADGLLPPDEAPLCGRPSGAVSFAPGCPAAQFFFAGDQLVNLNSILVALTTVFAREHNRQAGLMAGLWPDWDDERLFQEARLRTIGLAQAVTYREYLPAVLGSWLSLLPPYGGYDPSVDPTVDVFFATALRYGHSATLASYPLIADNWVPYGSNSLPLIDLMAKPQLVSTTLLDALIRGAVFSYNNAPGPHAARDMRNSVPSFIDVIAFDVQTTRDYGLPSFGALRNAYGLPPVSSWRNLSSDPTLTASLKNLYGPINNGDPYVAALCETRAYPSDELPPLMAAALAEQFNRTRAGDRFFYAQPSVLPAADIATIQSTTLSQIIVRNSGISWLPSSAFVATPIRASASGAQPTNGAGAHSIQPFPNYMVSWSIQGSFITVTMQHQAPLIGWMGMGFGTNMIKTDLIAAFVSGTSVTVLDAYTFDHMPQPDTAIGGRQDVSSGNSSIVNGAVTVTWTRKLDTGDQFDSPITQGTMNVIFAHNLSPGASGYHGAGNRVAAQVNFYTGTTSVANGAVSALQSVQSFHGAVMFTTWTVIYPAGIWIARYQKHRNWWVPVHRLMQSTGVVSAATFLIVGILSGLNVTMHGVVGLCLFSALVFQAAMGYLAVFLQQRSADIHGFRTRTIVRWVHRGVGWSLVCVAPYQCYLGLTYLAPNTLGLQYALFTWVGVVVTVFLVSEVYRRTVIVRGQMASGHKDLPTATWEEVAGFVRAGNMLLVVDGLVVNIKDWVGSHPGGRALLEHRVGTDVTELFHGRDSSAGLKKIGGLHAHSALASRAVAMLAKYRLADRGGNAAARKAAEAAGVINDSAEGFSLARVLDYPIVANRRVNADKRGVLRVIRITARMPTRFEDTVALGSLFYPGQHLSVQATISGNVIERAYTPLSLPDTPTGHFDLVLKVYSKGLVSRYLNGCTTIDELRARGPIGQPLLNPNRKDGCWRHVLMLAGGTGVTPMLQVIEYHAQRRHQRKRHYHTVLTLICYNHSAHDIPLRELVDEYAARPRFLTVHHCITKREPGWTGQKGRVRPRQIKTALGAELTAVFVAPTTLEKDERLLGDDPVEFDALLATPASSTDSEALSMSSTTSTHKPTSTYYPRSSNRNTASTPVVSSTTSADVLARQRSRSPNHTSGDNRSSARTRGTSTDRRRTGSRTPSNELTLAMMDDTTDTHPGSGDSSSAHDSSTTDASATDGGGKQARSGSGSGDGSSSSKSTTSSSSPQGEERLVVVSGPLEFLKSAKRALDELGVPEKIVVML